MNTQTAFTTDRLSIAPLNIADSAFIFDLLNTEGWIKFIGNRNINSPEDAQEYINRINTTAGVHYWTVSIKNSNVTIGLVTLIQRSYLPCHDIGFAFLPLFAGQGYAYEAAAAFMKIVFNQFKLPKLLAITLPANKQSIKLLEKLGMKFEKEMDEGEEKLLQYSIEA